MTWAGGRRVRLRTLFSRRDQTNRSDLPMLSVYRDFGVVPREGRDDNYNKPGADLAAYRVVHSGDLVLNKMKTWQGSLGISDREGIVSPAYIVAKPLTKDHPRFLHHLLRSPPLVADYGARSKGIRPSQWDLPWDEFRDINVELPALHVQRAIADFVDRESARIDALIAAKKRMLGLLAERAIAVVEDGVLDADWPLISLGWVIRGMQQGWSPQCDARLPGEHEWGVLKVGCVNHGHFRPDELKALPADIAPRAEYQVQNGDLLVSRANTRALVGSAAIVEAVRPKTLLCDKLFRFRLESRADPQFVNLFLQTRTAREQIELDATGASDSMQNIGQATLRRIKMPFPDREVQAEFVRRCVRERALIMEMHDRIEIQLGLLRERRQSLITVAVTGNLDIPEAA